MIKDVKVEISSDVAQKAFLRISWEWVDNKDGSLPSCNIFYCSLPENQLLEKGLFLENEILAHFNENVVGIYAPDVRDQIEVYCQRNPTKCVRNRFQRQNSYKEVKQLSVPSDPPNGIILLCIYDEYEIQYRVVAGSNGGAIPFEIIKVNPLKKLFGGKDNRKGIILSRNDNRKKVIKYRSGGNMIYSVLPEGYTEYYFDESVDLSRIKIYYLSSLIGKSGIGEE